MRRARATPRPRPDVAPLSQPQGLEPSSIAGTQGDPVGTVRSHLRHKIGFATRDGLLARLRANKSELLRVLERPDIPLNTNGSESDIRCQVTKRKISGGTWSGDCRNAFLGLSNTCAKLGIAFWDYLGARLAVPGCNQIRALPDNVSPHLPRPPQSHRLLPLSRFE